MISLFKFFIRTLIFKTTSLKFQFKKIKGNGKEEMKKYLTAIKLNKSDNIRREYGTKPDETRLN